MGRTVELYTASYTGKLLYNARNRPIQRAIMVPRIRIAHSVGILYSTRVYSRAIQDTAYTLYSPIRRPSVYDFRFRAPYAPTLTVAKGEGTLSTSGIYTVSGIVFGYPHTRLSDVVTRHQHLACKSPRRG